MPRVRVSHLVCARFWLFSRTVLLHGNLRKQFSRLLTVYVERHRLLTDGDPKGMYPAIMQAVFKLTPAALKTAFKEG